MSEQNIKRHLQTRNPGLLWTSSQGGTQSPVLRCRQAPASWQRQPSETWNVCRVPQECQAHQHQSVSVVLPSTAPTVTHQVSRIYTENKGNGKHALDIAPPDKPHLRSAEVWPHYQWAIQFYQHSGHRCVYPQTDWTIPAFTFPAKAAGLHLPTLEEWKAELA